MGIIRCSERAVRGWYSWLIQPRHPPPLRRRPLGLSASAALSTIDWVQVIAANIMWEPVPAVNIGLQYEYMIASLMNGPNAKASRLELAFRYSF